jgi:hypothetical protein
MRSPRRLPADRGAYCDVFSDCTLEGNWDQLDVDGLTGARLKPRRPISRSDGRLSEPPERTGSFPWRCRSSSARCSSATR